MSEEAKKGPTGLDRQSSNSLDIPSRTVLVKDASELPSSYCMTPGGTMYSTTPGGTRIIYDRKMLLQLRDSPYSRTPPTRLPPIPDIIAEGSVAVPQGTKSPLAVPSENQPNEPEVPFPFEIET
ncbi:PREDICTED: eukaryotic translation initiation factor 4E-binding protein 2-like [Amphimedon queenslandica]|uniref:Uncharacterized protein n=1 Tax=Amphimedon queenslandica TaxID=400682 RepID=A0A1X7V6X4_AMPQE|nr:PREDICTED: eukaryotic translation initiation factor 4E-binding protein 2-like [Amphimedon queenslandica]|eukprot:XP_003385481.1 PREDICTED: eukaryotic translation initiation factor 4E-binding protein 2-like [Amphimedon queenslandica]